MTWFIIQVVQGRQPRMQKDLFFFPFTFIPCIQPIMANVFCWVIVNLTTSQNCKQKTAASMPPIKCPRVCESPYFPLCPCGVHGCFIPSQTRSSRRLIAKCRVWHTQVQQPFKILEILLCYDYVRLKWLRRISFIGVGRYGIE